MSSAERRPTMLIVDDEPDVAEVIAEFAGRAGYEVVTTSSPEAFDGLYHDGLDVIVLDLWMPQVDGIELIRRLAQRRSTARLVLVSGFDRRVLESASQLALSHGLRVAGALGKPLRLAELTEVLDGGGLHGPRRGSSIVEVTLAEFQRAFDEDRLEVHYQPQVSLATGAVVGVEALVRWRLPDGGILPPEMFVQIAEAAGLSLALTWRVIEKAVAQAAPLVDPWKLTLSVNLPPAALTDIHFPDVVLGRVRGTTLAPPRLHFEVTETSLAAEPMAALDILTRLRLKGFPLAIDDFGVGYSSLIQLRELPLSALKVDKSFVRRMDRDPASRAIVERSIALGHDLGLTVVAEGAETASVWDALRLAGCDVVQGYYVHAPAPAAELAAWLPSWGGNRA
jgi:EAL domain-containing protein (putative c-di-GMP-specific phosphodiesterase class I)